MNSYFLTGATGTVGSAIVPLLLEIPDTEVWVLIRAASAAAMTERLESLFRFWGIQADTAKRGRLHGLLGDTGKPRFGLEPPAFENLIQHCTHILHCAGTVRMNLSIEEARRASVGSASEILDMARRIAQAGRLAKVDIVSTVGVAGKYRGTFREEWLNAFPEFHNTYEHAKAEAEALIRTALETDRLPITVHRPSMVIGDSASGRVIHFQIFYFLCEFLSGRKTLGLYPDFADVRLDVVPSDLVAKAIVLSSRDPATIGRIFHLSSGPEQAPRIEDVKTAVRQAFKNHGLPLPLAINLPMRLYAALARLAARLAPASQRKALATLPIYLDYLADRQAFGNEKFAAWFAGHGHVIPAWRQYLPKVLEYYLSVRYPQEPRP